MKLLGAADLPEACTAEAAFQINGFVYDHREGRTMLRKGASGLHDPNNVGVLAALRLDEDSQALLPPTGCAFVRDATLIGTRTAIWGTNFTTDIYFRNGAEQDAHVRTITGVSAHHWQNEGTGLQMRGGNCVLTPTIPKKTVVLPEPVVFIGSHEFSTWGSFLFRNLPKVLLARKLAPGIPRILTWAGHRNWLDLLAATGFPAETIIPLRHDTIYKAGKAVIPTIQSPHIFLAPEVVSFYQEIAAQFTTQLPHRDIYVSRTAQAKTGRRVCLNELDLCRTMEALGFEVVDPSSMSVPKQIKLFAEARTIVGPSGSGMFNCVFSRPGTKVFDIESESTWISAHANLFASMGHEYRFIQGKPAESDDRPVHRNWTVDISSTADYIHECCKRHA